MCSVAACDAEEHAQGLCARHYRRKARTGVTRLQTPEQRFWLRVVKGDHCWTWIGPQREGHGYWRGRKAHRVAWEYLRGPLTAQVVLTQSCGNRLCVRPAHQVTARSSQAPR